MKKLITIVFISVFFWTCNNGKNSENNSNTKISEAGNHQHESNATGLTLNKGVKWKADSTTNRNVKGLLTIIQKFNEANKSLEAYKKIAEEFQEGLNKMISECKMQGPAHEALHMWLEPLIEKVTELKNASGEVNAAQIWAAIQNQSSLYTQYFE